MTSQLAAHLRLITTLPVRRHEWRPPPKPVSTAEIRKQPSRRDGRERRVKVRTLLAEGLSQRAIAARLDVSRTTIFNHVRAIKAEARNG